MILSILFLLNSFRLTKLFVIFAQLIRAPTTLHTASHCALTTHHVLEHYLRQPVKLVRVLARKPAGAGVSLQHTPVARHVK